MKINISLFMTLIVVFFPSVGLSQGLVEFTQGTIASPEDVNHNFSYLDQRLERLGELASATRLDIDVDCSRDPGALRRAYLENIRESHLNFAITGACWGSIQDEQVHGQVISIFGSGDSPDVASLIADDRGQLNIGASFGGGLYLSNLTVVIPEDASNAPILFSRNSHGDVKGVVISGGRTSTAILAQRGAQAYIYDVDIDVGGMGIVARDGAKLVFLGYLGTVSVSADQPLLVASGSTLNMYGSVALTSKDVSKSAFGVISSTVTMRGGSLNLKNGGMAFVQSTGEFDNTKVNIVHDDISGSSDLVRYYGVQAWASNLLLRFSGFSVSQEFFELGTEIFGAFDNSSVSLENSTGNRVMIPKASAKHSYLNLKNNFDLERVHAESAIVGITDGILPQGFLYQSDLVAGSFNINLNRTLTLRNSNAYLTNPLDATSLGALNCQGLSAIEISGQTLEYPSETNCLDFAAWDRLIQANMDSVSPE